MEIKKPKKNLGLKALETVLDNVSYCCGVDVAPEAGFAGTFNAFYVPGRIS